MDIKLFHEILRSAWTAVAVFTFVAIVVWAFWPGNRAKFDERARIPLDER